MLSERTEATNGSELDYFIHQYGSSPDLLVIAMHELTDAYRIRNFLSEYIAYIQRTKQISHDAARQGVTGFLSLYSDRVRAAVWTAIMKKNEDL